MTEHIGTSGSKNELGEEIGQKVTDTKEDPENSSVVNVGVEDIVRWGDVEQNDEHSEDEVDEDPSEPDEDDDGAIMESRSVKSEELSTEPSDQDLSDEAEDDLEFADFVTPIRFGSVNPLEGVPCLCRTPKDLESALSLLELMETIEINFDNHVCIIDNVIRCYNYIFSNTNTSANRFRVAFADLFYRVRHETFYHILCKSLNLPSEHSDKRFSEFGLDSERTPDLIYEKDGVLYIIEVAVTSNMEKAAQSKGTEQYEFESKYAREMRMFSDLGRATSYLPIFFDMTNPSHPYTREQFASLSKVFNVNKAFKVLLDQYSKSMSILTNNFKDSLILPSTILFSNMLKIKGNHPNLEFLYRKSRSTIKTNYYKEMVISPYVYSKFCNEKRHLFWLIDNTSIKKDTKVIFCVAGNSNRITLEPNEKGELAETLRDIIIDCHYTKLFEFVRIRVGSSLIPATSNEQGIKMYERTIEKSKRSIEEIPLISNHSTTDIFDKFDTSKYKRMIQEYTSDNYHSVHFDPEYEDKIINSICNFDQINTDGSSFMDLPGGLLGNIKSKDINIDIVLSEIKHKYLSENSANDTLPIRRLKMKQPFILPIADFNESSYCKLEYKNVNFIDRLMSFTEDTNPYTSLIFKNVNNPNYSMYSKTNPASSTLLNLESERYRISNEINKLQKDLLKKVGSGGEYKISKTTDPYFEGKFSDLKSKYNKVVKEIRVRKKGEGVQQNISYIKLPTKNRGSNLRRLYDVEMSHFKDKSKQSTIEGVGIINNIEDDYKVDFKIFTTICNMLCDYRGVNPDKVLDEYISDDAKLIKDLKVESMDIYKPLIEQVTNSCLGHAAAFISRMAHSLMFHSQLPFSSDYIRVDNLGYKNAMLIIRGGKKIFKSKSSKLFRLIFPISNEILPWYVEGHSNRGSFEYYNIDGVNYALTPWSMLHESILTDAISFYHRTVSFTVLNLNPKVELKLQFHKVALNVLLGFHNRRQTEVVLANLRYILLSTLGDFTGVTQILGEFFGFNYDRFQSFIRNGIMLNYPTYFKTLQVLKNLKKSEMNVDIGVSDFINTRLKNIFNGMLISSVEDLALMIYSTFLMTKAPYQKLVERANNVKGILDIHELFDVNVGLDLEPEGQLDSLCVTNDGSLINYAKNLFGNDFKFDPKFCALVGGFIDSVFKAQDEQDGIEANWLRILNQPWDEMATSTGLRGEYSKIEDFWGQKGYFVIYKKLLNQPGFADKLDKVMSDEFTSDEKRKMLRSLNEVFLDKVDGDTEFLVFHAVDKVQWRGGREIYVMDMNTKMLQQPIEKFMAYLCKKLDNELISIPSDRRAQVIHHSIFEKDIPVKGNITWFLTLDCSKWAPKSIFVKFVITILNMSTIPNSFKTHFMNYIEKLYKKRIYFNKGEVEVLLKNPQQKDKVEKYLKLDEVIGGYYLEMPYSWVMGIFNYTSSFLHAANQKYFSYILTKSTMLSYKEETSMVMFAHSDDSGGRLSVSNDFMAQRALVLYEIFLKSCNHLLSKKKSVVSRIYFEILSVIYLFKKLLALLPKFLGGLRFLPTDKGPAQDILQSYSKSIEVMVAGGDFSIAYLVMKIYSHLVWKFYFNRNPTPSDYERPVQYIGMPDAHPLFSLLCGSDADILRLIRNGVNLSALISFVNMNSSTMDEEGPIKPLKFEIKVKGIKRGFEDYIELFKAPIESWSVRNVNFHNTAMNSLSFLRKLNDSGFVGSLVNESTTRRISRAFYIRFADSAITKFGNIKLSQLMDSINLCQAYKTNKSDSLQQLFKEILGEQSIEEIKADFDSSLAGSERTLRLLVETLKSPLKIYRYLDMVGLQGRKINVVNRTLKPTLLQLVKSSKVFSNIFDPASLVSYMKEKEWNWALNDVRGLHTSSEEVEKFLSDMGFTLSEVSPDLLLRVCRTYGRENTKSIYLYSRVPGEMRQIKTYSAFLTFLSVNSFYNKEIQGLTLKISDRETNKDYLEPHLKEEIYFINDAISMLNVLIEKCGSEFVENITLNEVLDINWQGGKVIKFLEFLKDLYDTDVRYPIIKGQVNGLLIKLGLTNSSADAYVNSAFYTFLVSQKMRGGWYGKGEVYIQIDNNYYSIVLFNNEITSIYTNMVGKLPLHHSEFIKDVTQHIGVKIYSMKRPRILDYNRMHFGLDCVGDISIFQGREIEKGVPAVILDSRNCFIDDLINYEVSKIEKDWILVKRGSGSDCIFKKLNFIPVRKGEIVPIMKIMLNPNDFSMKLMEVGLSDFEEFIYTEILTEYGKNVVTDFETFIDNYQSSMLYQIFQDVYKKGYSKINRKLDFSTLPASEGSLIRILIDYSVANNAGILKVPRNLNSTMMQIRSEFSDRVVSLIGEKSLEYFTQIYSTAEKKEISDHYNAISRSDDIKVVRNSVIKLMTYWGYGSLVNSIETFSLKRELSNYLYFNKMNGNKYRSIFSERFVDIAKGLIDLFSKWRPLYNQFELMVPSLKRFIDPDYVIIDYLHETVMATYYDTPTVGLWVSLYPYIFATVLLTYMKDEDFIAELQNLFSSIHLLSSLPISWNCRYDVISVINVLRDCWVNENVAVHELSYVNKNQRLPDGIPNFKAKLKIFDINIPPARSYYHGFLNETILSFIYGKSEIKLGNTNYRLDNKVTSKSNTIVYMEPFLKHLAPLTEDFLEHDNYEELLCEHTMDPIDDDTILEYVAEIPKPHYIKSSIRKQVFKTYRNVIAKIYWIINPFISNDVNNLKYYRQVGENIIVLTDAYTPDFLDCFPNSGLRILNLSKILKKRVQPMFAYYSFHNDLNKKEFIDALIGGVDYRINEVDMALVQSNVTRSVQGLVCDPSSSGMEFSEIAENLTEGKILADIDGCIVIKDQNDVDQAGDEEIGVRTSVNPEEAKYRRVQSYFTDLERDGIIDSSSINRMKEKYIKKSISEGVGTQTIISSIATEKDLIMVNNSVISGNAELSAEDQKKMHLNPEYFGVVRALDVSNSDPIKDKKTRSEINSLHDDLSRLIGSSNLNLSHKFKKIVEANYKMWTKLYKSGKTKKENKGFLLTLFSSLCANTFVNYEECDDTLWQDISNKVTLYIAQDDEDDDDEDEFPGIFNIKVGARLRYRAEGT